MPRFTTVALVLSIFATIASGQADPSLRWNVYVLTGQSNALGTTWLEGDDVSEWGPGTDPADAATEFFWSNVDANNISFPPDLYGDSAGTISTLQMQQGDTVGNDLFWGPEFGLARELYALGAAGRTLIVKATRGGGGNALWNKTVFESNNDDGHMWGHLCGTVDQALASIAATGGCFAVRGLLYMQGEGDSAPEAAMSETRITDLHTNFKAHVNSLYPNAADQMQTAVLEFAASTTTALRVESALGQIDASLNNADIIFIRTTDLPLKIDNLHFPRDSKLEAGARAARALFGVAEPYESVRYVSSAGDPQTAAEVESPPMQGFSETGFDANVTSQGVLDGTEPAWQLLDDSSSVNPTLYRSLPLFDLGSMYQGGWVLRARARVVSGGGTALWSVTDFADPGWGIATGTGTMNGFRLSRLAGDELHVSLWAQPVKVALGPGSADAYHTFELRGQPQSTLCDFYIDDVLYAQDIDFTTSTGGSGLGDRLVMQSGSGSGTGRDTYWTELSITALPVNAPLPCGFAVQYGTGCAGQGGFIPNVSMSGCLRVTESFDLDLTQGLGGANAAVVIGYGRSDLTIAGDCALYIADPIPTALPVVLSGALPGEGSYNTLLDGPLGVPVPLCFTLQAFVFDEASPLGLSVTPGLEIRID